MPEPIVYYYRATRHDETKEENLEFVLVEETAEAFVGTAENGGKTNFPKTEWKSLEQTGFRPFWTR